MAKTPHENLDLFLISSKRLDDYKDFILNQNIDSLILGLAEQETDEPDYTPTIVSVTEIIQNYGLVLIGTLSGYFPESLTEKFKDQIIRFLEIEPIREFYSLRKKLFIGDGILAYTIGANNNDIKSFFSLLEDEEDKEEVQDFFNEFLVLYYGLKKDQNIKIFLKIFDFYSSLESQAQVEKMHKAFQSHSEIENAFNNPEPNLIVGAINFLLFVSELKKLIDRAFFAPVLQSTMWHFYGYYFEKNANEIINFYSTVFDNLTSRFNEVESIDTFLSNLNTLHKEENITFGRDHILQSIDIARNDIVNICDKNYSKPLTN